MDYTTQLYGDYFINHNKDPYESTSIMESRDFFFVAHLLAIRKRQSIASMVASGSPNRW